MGPRKARWGKTRAVACAVALLCAAAILVARAEPQKHGNSRFRGATAGHSKRAQEAANANPYGVHFRDVTSAAGIRFHHERAASAEKLYLGTMGAGVAWLDYKQDGFMDIFFANSGWTPFFHSGKAPQPALYRNNGDGT